MKIIIIDNAFNLNYVFYLRISAYLSKLVNKYKRYKVCRLVRELKQEYNNQLKIKIISNQNKKYFVDKDIEFVLLSDYRLSLERDKFISIIDKIKPKTKEILTKVFQDSKKLRKNYIENIFIGDIIEMPLLWFLNKMFGQFELLKQILQNEEFDKVIFINQNPLYLDFFLDFKNFFKNIEICFNSFISVISKIPKLLKIKYILGLILKSQILSIKTRIQQKKIKHNVCFKTLLFVSNSENQFNSIKNIHHHYKKNNRYNTLKYSNLNFLSLSKIPKLITFMIYLKQCWKNSFNSLFINFNYEEIKVNNLLKDFYNTQLFFVSPIIFNQYNNFKKFTEKYNPSIVFISNEMSPDGRLYSCYCSQNNIPTIYIPHAAFPIYDESITRKHFSYINVPGESDKNYLLIKGEKERKIILTGRPRYEKIYRGSLKKLYKIKDSIENREYYFDRRSFTILFTTSPIDYEAKKRGLDIVVTCLKELNLIDSLIIKIHPRESILWYKKRLSELGVNPIVVKQEYDIFELINSCDLLLSRTSTTILEAMIIGTPVIILSFMNLKFHITGTYLFSRDNRILNVKTIEELKVLLMKIINNKSFYQKYRSEIKKISKKYNYYDTNRTSFDIIVDLIDKILI